MPGQITINRAPVLTLWAAVVAERAGYDPEAALTLGKCVAGLNAQSKANSTWSLSAPSPPVRDAASPEVGGRDVLLPAGTRVIRGILSGHAHRTLLRIR